MVQYQRLFKKEEKLRVAVEEGSSGANAVAFSGGGYLKRANNKILLIAFLSFLSCCYIFSFSSSSLLDAFSRKSERFGPYEPFIAPLCSGISTGTICCDRTGFRSDICIMKGDIRTNSTSSSIFLFTSLKNNSKFPQKIKPYTRKWETSVMQTVQELNLLYKHQNSSLFEHNNNNNTCDVLYQNVPAIFFSTGGYTGNVYHEFNDGIIPLFITSQHFNKNVVFVIVEYHTWWITKYGDIVSQLSNYPPIDFNGDKRRHCFKEAIIGLKIHDELTIDSSLMLGNNTILDLRKVLDRAYWPRIHGLIQDEELKETNKTAKTGPKLVIISRNGSREILNQNLLVKLAEEIGFTVKVLKPDKTTELAKIYRCLNSSDVMISVHGAASTHFLFMKPKTVFIQIIPLGTEWASETYYGEPAKKMKLNYIGYKIKPKESSLYDEFGENDPIIQDPKSFTRKGWDYTKKIYLEHQNVTLDLTRFGKCLLRAYDLSVKRIGPVYRSRKPDFYN